jgi:uncharacterized protein YecE (DUF72 family)
VLSVAARDARVRVGVAGWDYPDWAGVVYPKGAADRLAIVARYVDLIEINSTFYRPCAPRTAAGWVERIAALPRFVFTAKAHRSWTHEDPADLGREVRLTLDGLAPLHVAGRLGALLVQFPQSFQRDEEALSRLSQIADLAAGWPLVVELRHRSWDDEPTAAWLAERALGWCIVDQPRIGRSTIRLVPRLTSSVAYVRLHGRNARDWFREDAGRDARYDYLYAPDELAGVLTATAPVLERAAQAFVVQNNHFRGQALVNALELRHLIEQERPAAPADLVVHYPRLGDHVRVEGPRLF